jgi:hypothetical protein
MMTFFYQQGELKWEFDYRYENNYLYNNDKYLFIRFYPRKRGIYGWSYQIKNGKIDWTDNFSVQQILKLSPQIKQFAQDCVDRANKLMAFL